MPDRHGIDSRPLASKLKYALKWTVAQALYWTGLLHIWVRGRFRNRALVVAYHRVLSSEARAATRSHPAIIVSPLTFERQLTVLKKLFHLQTLAEFEAALTRDPGFSRPSCLVTFDDGWWDTYSEAWPVMRRAGVPAVIFLPVNFIGSDNTFWQERLGHLLTAMVARVRGSAELRHRAGEILRRGGLEDLLEIGDHEFDAVVVDRVRTLKTVSTVDPMALLTDVESFLGGTPSVPAVDRFMTWQQVRDMAQSGMAFGGHGSTHCILSRVSPAEVKREVEISKARLEKELQSAVSAMSYPNGGWTPSVASLVRAAGYRLAFTMEYGAVMKGDDARAVKRVNIHEDATDSMPMFLARVAGIL